MAPGANRDGPAPNGVTPADVAPTGVGPTVTSSKGVAMFGPSLFACPGCFRSSEQPADFRRQSTMHRVAPALPDAPTEPLSITADRFAERAPGLERGDFRARRL